MTDTWPKLTMIRMEPVATPEPDVEHYAPLRETLGKLLGVEPETLIPETEKQQVPRVA